ncbi:hypothetical protein [Arthrobacter sp. NicSoilB11]|uniref:hypothetical protein n=1 Tax=Arthrobacter sp. NicSoilB11 TaxID=2830999 RepID=UPI001CC44412|nr:hypothetical protein [Arthrobacter sp. NicSoilB11]
MTFSPTCFRSALAWFRLALGLQDAAGSLLPLPPAFSQRRQSCRPVPWCLQSDVIKVDRTFIDEFVQGPHPRETAVMSLVREVGASWWPKALKPRLS